MQNHSREVLDKRISELEEKLTQVEAALVVEMEKHYSARQYNLLYFLDKEQAVYRFALSELVKIADTCFS